MSRIFNNTNRRTNARTDLRNDLPSDTRQQGDAPFVNRTFVHRHRGAPQRSRQRAGSRDNRTPAIPPPFFPITRAHFAIVKSLHHKRSLSDGLPPSLRRKAALLGQSINPAFNNDFFKASIEEICNAWGDAVKDALIQHYNALLEEAFQHISTKGMPEHLLDTSLRIVYKWSKQQLGGKLTDADLDNTFSLIKQHQLLLSSSRMEIGNVQPRHECQRSIQRRTLGTQTETPSSGRPNGVSMVQPPTSLEAPLIALSANAEPPTTSTAEPPAMSTALPLAPSGAPVVVLSASPEPSLSASTAQPPATFTAQPPTKSMAQPPGCSESSIVVLPASPESLATTSTAEPPAAFTALSPSKSSAQLPPPNESSVLVQSASPEPAVRPSPSSAAQLPAASTALPAAHGAPPIAELSASPGAATVPPIYNDLATTSTAQLPTASQQGATLAQVDLFGDPVPELKHKSDRVTSALKRLRFDKKMLVFGDENVESFSSDDACTLADKAGRLSFFKAVLQNSPDGTFPELRTFVFCVSLLDMHNLPSTNFTALRAILYKAKKLFPNAGLFVLLNGGHFLSDSDKPCMHDFNEMVAARTPAGCSVLPPPVNLGANNNIWSFGTKERVFDTLRDLLNA